VVGGGGGGGGGKRWGGGGGGGGGVDKSWGMGIGGVCVVGCGVVCR